VLAYATTNPYGTTVLVIQQSEIGARQSETKLQGCCKGEVKTSVAAVKVLVDGTFYLDGLRLVRAALFQLS
jgi:hypothetical protein